MKMNMNERINELTKEMKPQMVDFAQRIIRCPSLSGQEGNVAKIIRAELEKLGYDDVFVDEWGNVVGGVQGTITGSYIV